MMTSRWFVAICAILLGAILGFIQAPYHFRLALLAWPVAYILAQRSGRDFTIGYFFGFGYFIHVMSWIAEPFAVGPPQYASLGWLAWFLMGAGLALFWWPLFALRKFGWYAVPLGYLILEGVRAVIFTGLPWGLMAHGFIDSPLAQSAAFIGTFLLSAMLVAIVLALFIGRGVWPRALALVAVLALLLPAFVRPDPTNIEWADYHVTIVQANHPQEYGYDPALWRARLDEHIALSDVETDLVIWPESAVRFSPSDDPQLGRYILDNIQADAIIFGAPSFDDDRFYNSAYSLTQTGQASRYDKRHLVPFGEYIPFGDWLMARGLFVETVTTFAGRKGDERPWLIDETHPRPIIIICYEGIFPWLSRQNGDYLVQITNDSWFGTRSGPYQHLDIARYRAIENGMPLLRSAITGVSAVIDANGRVIDEIPLNTQGTITQALGPRYDMTFYRLWGEWLSVLVAAIGIVGIVWRRRFV